MHDIISHEIHVVHVASLTLAQPNILVTRELHHHLIVINYQNVDLLVDRVLSLKTIRVDLLAIFVKYEMIHL